MKKDITIKYIQLGLLGGLVGTVLMDIVMFVELYIAHMSLYTNYTVIGAAVGRGAWIGLIIHFIVGPTLGLLFGLIVSMNSEWHIHDIKKGLILGIFAGVITIPFGCVPLAILSKVPILKLVSFSTLPHFIWGAGLGWVTGYGMKKMTVQHEKD